MNQSNPGNYGMTAPDHEQAERIIRNYVENHGYEIAGEGEARGAYPMDTEPVLAALDVLAAQLAEAQQETWQHATERASAQNALRRAQTQLAEEREARKLADDLVYSTQAQLAERERELKRVTNQRDQWEDAYEARFAYYKRDVPAATHSDSEASS